MGIAATRHWHTSAFPSLLLYIILSSATSYLNRSLFHDYFFDYGVALLILQMAMSLFILEIARCFNCLSIHPYTLDRGKSLLLPSLLYFFSCYVTDSFLYGFDTPIFNLLKRCVPLVVLTLPSAKRPGPDRYVVTAVGIVTVGLVVAGLQPIDFDLHSLLYGLLTLVLQSSYLVFIERAASTGQYSIMDMIYYNTFNCLILSLTVDLIVDESRDALAYFLTSATFLFWIAFFCALVTGALLQWALFYCIVRTSALTTSVVGGLMSAVDLTISSALFSIGGGIAGYKFIGLIASFIGCALYAIHVKKDLVS